MYKLDTQVMFLPSIGPERAKILATEHNIVTVEDLLNYYPYKYVDRSKIWKIKDLSGVDEYVQIRGQFTYLTIETTSKRRLLRATFEDDTGSIGCVWFDGIKYIAPKIKLYKEYVIYGKTGEYKNSFNIEHPKIYELSQFEANIVNPIMPEYTTTEKMKKHFLYSQTLAKLIKNIFDKGVEIDDFIPEYIRKRLGLIDKKDALYKIHFPLNSDDLSKAKYRLKFEELFINQLSLLKQKILREKNVKGFVFSKVGEYFMDFYNNRLPFELTNAQKRVIKELRNDFRTGRQANRLLQGDVGSGKTIVALMCMLLAKDNGFQSCIMAPTEVLAQQHFESITRLTEGMDLNIRLLTSSTNKKQRKIIDEQLVDGSLDILIGTHALIEDNVVFKNLGLAIIDEQHKFGVLQRAKLRQKNKIPPHIVVMTATPIPRTLSMALYGDLDVSVIDELPIGRKPIITKHIYHSQKDKLIDFLKREIHKGRQVYVVYPLIQESEAFDYRNLEEGYEYFVKHFPQPQYKIAMVHGKMSSEEKKLQMEEFVSHKAQILVATMVIEVGVNVPNATVMVIESAEKFGLSQLHQLRGRVGRGAEQSYCILVTDYKLSEEARKRIEIMTRTTNGFEIAEADLRMRGPGDVLGTQQSGLPINFKLANIATDGKILSIARETAAIILKDDPSLEKLEHQKLAAAVDREISKSLSNIS